MELGFWDTDNMKMLQLGSKMGRVGMHVGKISSCCCV